MVTASLCVNAVEPLFEPVIPASFLFACQWMNSGIFFDIVWHREHLTIDKSHKNTNQDKAADLYSSSITCIIEIFTERYYEAFIKLECGKRNTPICSETLEQRKPAGGLEQHLISTCRLEADSKITRV